MITNSKKDFFEQLEYELRRIGIKLTDDIKTDFDEHFAECKGAGVSEEDAAKQLGDVKEIARNYLNLESSRINSMVARDIEHNKISLTKPGRDIPADLSLMKEKEEQDAKSSDCVREYTPEHFSEEIYPHSQNSQRQSSFGYNTSSNSQVNSRTENTAGASGNSGKSAEKSADSSKSVSDAFSNVGKAVADAAKLTGSAIADAFGQKGVKDAVVNAGKSAADAVKTAGHSAAEVVKSASQNVAGKAKSIPRPSDSCRENSNHERKGTIPDNPNNISSKKGSHFTDVKGLKPNVNVGKLIAAIIMDVFLWSWILTALISICFGMIGGGVQHIFTSGIPAFFNSGSVVYSNWIVALLMGIGHCSLGLIISLVGICLVQPIIKLVKFIIEQHIKAIYDL